MLVLTRRAGDALVIGKDIEITVIEIQGDKVKIGVKAPRNIGVLRKELITQAENANIEAASPGIDIEKLAKALGK